MLEATESRRCRTMECRFYTGPHTDTHTNTRKYTVDGQIKWSTHT